jgi:hypothetical protein
MLDLASPADASGYRITGRGQLNIVQVPQV